MKQLLIIASLAISLCYGTERSNTSDLSRELDYLVRVAHPGVWFADGPQSCSFVGDIDQVMTCAKKLLSTVPGMQSRVQNGDIPGLLPLDAPANKFTVDAYDHMKALKIMVGILGPDQLSLPSVDELERAILDAQAYLVLQDWYPDAGYRKHVQLIGDPRYAPSELYLSEWMKVTTSSKEQSYVRSIDRKVRDLAARGYGVELNDLLTKLYHSGELTLEEKRYFDKCYTLTPPFKEVSSRLRQALDTFLQRLEAMDEDPVHLAAWIHRTIGEIHPFSDGNGRIARMLMNCTLMRGQRSPVIFLSDVNYTDAVNRDTKHEGAFESYLRSQVALVEKALALETELEAYKIDLLYEDDDDGFFYRDLGLDVAELFVDPSSFEQRPDARDILLQAIDEYTQL